MEPQIERRDPTAREIFQHGLETKFLHLRYCSALMNKAIEDAKREARKQERVGR